MPPCKEANAKRTYPKGNLQNNHVLATTKIFLRITIVILHTILHSRYFLWLLRTLLWRVHGKDGHTFGEFSLMPRTLLWVLRKDIPVAEPIKEGFIFMSRPPSSKHVYFSSLCSLRTATTSSFGPPALISEAFNLRMLRGWTARLFLRPTLKGVRRLLSLKRDSRWKTTLWDVVENSH